jgi:PadR family transcriptional regulator, regulatory protein PadR
VSTLKSIKIGSAQLMERKVEQNNQEPPVLSKKEGLILEMLASSGRDLYGLEMVELSNGSLRRGTVYVTLQRMQEKGLIDSRTEPRALPEIGIPRRLYTITGYGLRVLKGSSAARAAFVSELSTAGA